jgi:hypothetical protein
MEPISWSLIIGLMIKYGIPFAESVYRRWAAGGAPTQKDFDELKAMAAETPESLFLSLAASRGLTPDDPRVVELMKLIQGPTA